MRGNCFPSHVAMRIRLYLLPILLPDVWLRGSLVTFQWLYCSCDIAGHGFLQCHADGQRRKLCSVSSKVVVRRCRICRSASCTVSSSPLLLSQASSRDVKLSGKTCMSCRDGPRGSSCRNHLMVFGHCTLNMCALGCPVSSRCTRARLAHLGSGLSQ